MNIAIRMDETDLSLEKLGLLKDSLGLTNDTQLKDHITKLCKTALIEYVTMIVEKGLPTKAEEIKQDRLYFLIRYYYENRIPTEFDVSSIFHLTSTQSKSLLRNVKSRYKTKIPQATLSRTLSEVLSTAERNGNNWDIIIESDLIKEDINIIVSKKGPTLQLLKKKADSANQYEIYADTYNLLKKELDIP
jgi:hypothetical protein